MKTYKAGYQSVPKLLRKKVEFSNFLYFYARHSQSNWIAVELNRTQSVDWVRQLNQIELTQKNMGKQTQSIVWFPYSWLLLKLVFEVLKSITGGWHRDIRGHGAGFLSFCWQSPGWVDWIATFVPRSPGKDLRDSWCCHLIGDGAGNTARLYNL